MQKTTPGDGLYNRRNGRLLEFGFYADGEGGEVMNMSEADLNKLLASGNVRVAQNSVGTIAKLNPANTITATTENTTLKTPDIKPRGNPNKTEMEYGRMLGYEFPNSSPRFEALTFVMENGHRYTPDWIVSTPDGILCVEVKAKGKNGFRLPSYGRAKLAFDQAKLEWPQFRWRWAEKFNGSWTVGE